VGDINGDRNYVSKNLLTSDFHILRIPV
jgi:hypothetical protein